MQGATVATTSSRALVAACERLAIDVPALLEDAGLTAAQIADPDGRLPGEAVATLWRSALHRSGDPGLGLRVALAVPFGAYRIIDFLAASAPTVGEGLARVARYFPLVNSALAWELGDERTQMRVTLAHPTVPGELPRPYAEYALAVTILHCRRASGFDWPLVEVAFAFESPPDAAAHEAAFGCPARFGQPRNEFVISRATWELPSQAPSSELLRTLEEHADRLIAGLGREHVISVQVARLVTEELQGGEPSLAKIARRMAMSPRTLQRRLELEGTTFADVLDRTRRHFAQAYMKDRGLALTEIAYLLGFSEPSAFTRAFQRWYGTSPSQYRAGGAAAAR
ncbi:MAG: AraC family transcriptional regulator [Deltaproteobacteria bacterium]|nr:AraC family transcriptional regulator [Kofleriaceae bacterium]